MKIRFFISTISLIALTLTSIGQPIPVIQWQKTLGGTGNDNASQIEQTMDGGYIVAGFSASTDGDVTGNHGSADFWIVKLDNLGNIQWQKSLGGLIQDAATSIQQTADGGYVIAGYSNSNDGDVSGHHGAVAQFMDYWIVKIDATGNIQWQKNLGGTGSDNANQIEQTKDGGYIIAGSTSSTDGDVTGYHLSSETYYTDYWIVKLDSLGNLKWQKTLGGSGNDAATSVQQCTDGGYIVAGQTSSTDGDVTGYHIPSPTNFYYSADYWIVKLDSLGNLKWQKTLGGSGDDEPSSIRQTNDGNYIVAGYSNSLDGDITNNNNGYTHYWVVKLDTTGNIIWQKSLGGSLGETATSIYQTIDSGYIVSGTSYSNDGDVTGHHGLVTSHTSDYWIVKLDTIGNIVWQQSLGGTDNDQAQSIQQTAEGGYIIAGNTLSRDGDVTGYHYPGFVSDNYDFWIVKLSPDNSQPVPVTLLNFVTLKQELSILLNWQTTNEINNSYFVVQKSTDGIHFLDMQQISASGSSASTHSYSAIDNQPFNGNNYYRLKQVDNNGNYIFSKIDEVNFSEINTVQIAPNPVQGDNLSLIINNQNTLQTQLSITDAGGKLVLSKTLNIEAGLQTQQINIAPLSAGSYFVTITINTNKQVLKFIKE
jgi:hypothetical protein